jgi:ubiquinone/menaquinone biosynthesis C-methylase UbiE
MRSKVCLPEVLKSVGIRKGQTVLDFGCGSGTYTIPTAKIVGGKGIVYALDKDSKVLNKLIQRAKLTGLNHIEPMHTHGELSIDLADNSVDVTLLFDVLHSYYFPSSDDRRRLLDEVRRISKAEALILIYPKHRESTAKDEIESANFCFVNEYSATLIHNNTEVLEGQILIFTKR